MPTSVISATIPAGGSLSNAIDVTDGKILRIAMPADWTPANVTFQIATANVPEQFQDIVNLQTGGELMIGCRPGCTVALDETDFARDGFLKIRSGTSAHPMPQAAERVFQVVVFKGSTTSELP